MTIYPPSCILMGLLYTVRDQRYSSVYLGVINVKKQPCVPYDIRKWMRFGIFSVLKVPVAQLSSSGTLCQLLLLDLYLVHCRRRVSQGQATFAFDMLLRLVEKAYVGKNSVSKSEERIKRYKFISVFLGRGEKEFYQ